MATYRPPGLSGQPGSFTMGPPGTPTHFWKWSAVGPGTLETVQALLMAFYLIVVLRVGLWGLPSNRATINGFFIADQSLAWWLIGTSLFAANIGNSHFIGLSGIGASSGIAIGAFEWNTIFMLFPLAWIFVPIYNKAGVVTLPEYLRKRFGSVRIQVLFTILSILIDVMSRILVEVCYSTMFMKMAWNMDVYQITMILLMLTGTYAITGGLKPVVYTEALHAGIMILGTSVLMAYAFINEEGYETLLQDYFQAIPEITSKGNWTARPECYIPHQDAFRIFQDPSSGDFSWPSLVFGATTLSLFYGCADQVSVQRALAGKNMSHMKSGILLYGYLKLLPLFLMVMPGMISRVLYPDQVACVVPSECEKHCGSQATCSSIAYTKLVMLLPDGPQGIILCAVCGAILSSLTSAFSSVSALFTMNIYTCIRPRATENELMITARFFIITLLATTIVWIPITETALSERLFEYMLMIKSCLTPPLTALFVLAVFSKRVNEQGAFWGLTFGTAIGFFRLVAEFAYGLRTCEKSKCPVLICGIHYLYFGTVLLLFSLLSMQVISFFTDPIPDKHLHRLCWSLRKSQEDRVDLDGGRKWERLPRLTSKPTMFQGSHIYFWELFEMFFGLEPWLNPKVAADEATKKMKATEENVEHDDTLEDAEVLAPEEEPGKKKGTMEGTETKEWDDTLEKPLKRWVVNVSGIILFVLVVTCHIYYA